ncbi:glycerate kinase [Brevibacterium sp. JNUCC-42]|nr:glycerate kinase [Brevibacterium sp. JNUCC-42]
MKVLIAIDSFKGSLSSLDCGKAITEGIKDVYENAEIITFPLADGGEGTVEALVQATKGKFVEKEVIGPLGTLVTAVYGILGNNHTAVIEVAAACGLPLVPENERNPYFTTTYGVGQLICDAVEKGCKEFVIGLGGSATNDAGVGMLQALGFSYLDENNKEVGYGGYELQKICAMDSTHVHHAIKNCTFKVACDVNNPLHGKNGAAYIFGRQKGATTEMVKELDAGLEHFAHVTFRELNKDIQNIAGAGAAGGLGAAFAGFLDAELLSGVQLVLETVGLEDKISDVDLVITGEGKLDSQTSMGKAPLGVAQVALKHDIPVIALAGGVSKQAYTLNELGITSFFSITNEPMSLEKAMDSTNTFDNLRMTTKQLFRLLAAVKN